MGILRCILAAALTLAAQETPPPVRPTLPSPADIAKLPPDGGPEFNRLIFASSPYLLQHARNPVDWHPWGDEAFALAKQLDRPVFLSIGYSTCHWCHVMEHECFEDEAVARLLNEHFVCIKVDREERPDVDSVYMAFAQAFGRGGWPMSVFLDGERRPFHAATYIPKHGRGAMPGMMELLPAVARIWREDRAKLHKQAGELIEFVRAQQPGSEGTALSEAVIDRSRRALASIFDAEHGGFGDAPKFPVPHQLCFLLHARDAKVFERSREMVDRTLLAMRCGGIWDHVGFGFHRYSTDAEWLLPHFEKMLYDQALQAMAYTEGWQATGRPLYAETVEQIFTYVLRDMTDPCGGFYSAEDADSEGVEGKFYVWTTRELEAVLGADDARFFAGLMGFEEKGNFAEEATGHRDGSNIPHLAQRLELYAQATADPAGYVARFERVRAQLFAHREGRVHPLKDDKILTDWNGLMIAAMAKAGRAMQRNDWLEAAQKAGEFAWTGLRDGKTGRLFKRARAGQAGLAGLLDDYAFLAWGYLELHQATQDLVWLERAKALIDLSIEWFWDAEGGAFLPVPSDGEQHILASKDPYDGALPSGNSVQLCNLVRLARITGQSTYEERASALVRALGPQVQRTGHGHSQFLMGYEYLLGPSQEVLVTGPRGTADVEALLRTASQGLFPLVSVLHVPSGGSETLDQLAPFTASYGATGGAQAFVCTAFTCEAPTSDPAVLRASLEQAGPGSVGRKDDQ
ncbi:MAG: thioredoxin domain-containing protein [Planctomycetota bacterium]